MYSSVRRATAEDGSPWIVSDAPSLSKVVELPGNMPAPANNVDCSTVELKQPGQSDPEPTCGFNSPLGILTATGNIEIGSNGAAPLYGPDYQSFFLPTATSAYAVLALSSAGSGNEIGVYNHLSRAAMKTQLLPNGDKYYYVADQPGALLRDPVSSLPLTVNTSSMAFSANGDWMVVDMPHIGLLRVQMSDLATQLFAGPIEPPSFTGSSNPPLAISDDGRYAAANTDIFGDGNITIYDLSTCGDQLDVAADQQHFCTGKDVWHGLTPDGQPFGQGLLSRQPDLQRPNYLRFVNDGTISFDAKYAVQSGTVYKVASFTATAPGGVEHKIGLLGLGDSYISGQGAFDYRAGTDTVNSGCHLSFFSYPFLLGALDFDSYNSVACSGAKTDNVIGTNQKYQGQVRDKIPENKRDKPSILANFLPGYIYQQEFASTYTPVAILLSVGGDDVGFANIVKSCVANSGGGTCYDTYQERAGLLKEIDGTYANLVNTYTTLRQQSGGARLYVVGYPQIAKAGGDCGLNVHLNSDEVAFSAQLISYLDGVVQKAAQTAGVFYVDTQQAFDGHRLCEQGDKAMNGFTVGEDAGVTLQGHTIQFIGAESYHPTALGYRLLASTIAAKTANLTAPMPVPAAYAVPTLDPATPLLQGFPSDGQPASRTLQDDTIADDTVVRGDTQPVTVDGTAAQLQPGSEYQAVLHSNPVLLDEGGVDSSGNIATTVTIPGDTAPGYHTLHIYGTDMAGEPVDIQKKIYVAASADDYDGDGVANSASPCLLFPASGQDADQDGLDDACDPDIAPAATVDGQASAGGDVAASASIGTSSVVAGYDANPETGTVLGSAESPDTVPKPTVAARPKQSPGKQQLFRMNWLQVLEAGLAVTGSAAMVRHYIRRP